MKEPQDYSDLVARADKAVASVKDPELRRIAFQKILDDLLGSPQPTEAGAPAARPRKTSGKAASKSGPKGYIEELIEDGLFKKPKTISEVKAALENQGHHIAVTSLSGPLQKLCQQKVLRRQKGTGSGSYTYSLW